MIKAKVVLQVYCFLLCFLSPLLRADTARPVAGCGEQCVKLLCKFYNINTTETILLEFLSPNELGECSFKDISRCIKKIGLDSYAFKGSIKELVNVQTPTILLFKSKKDDTVGHFLVAMLDNKTDRLMGYDPMNSGRPFELTAKNLEAFWTGYGLAVFPHQSNHQLGWPLLFIAATFLFLGSGFAQIRTYWLRNKKRK